MAGAKSRELPDACQANPGDCYIGMFASYGVAEVLLCRGGGASVDETVTLTWS